METDYRKLCIELFGTDDVKKLKKAAQKLNDNRNAGRKKKFNESDIKNIKNLLESGVTINEISKKYNTSRQIIDKYINTPPDKGFSLRITYMHRQNPCTVIDVDFLNKKIKIKNRTDDILHRAFGVTTEPEWEDFEEFLKERCFPESRGNLKELLDDLNISSYDTLQIAEKNCGRTAEDNMWMKFKYYPQGEKYENNRLNKN